MSKRGQATDNSIRHSVEGSEVWQRDREYFDERKKVDWVAIKKNSNLIFESNTSALRPLGAKGKVADWGYMASSDWKEGSQLEVVTGKDYHDRLQSSRNALSYYDHVYERKDKKGNSYSAVRKIKHKVKDSSFLKRNTVDITPYLSRAIQKSLHDESAVVQMRDKIMRIMPHIAKAFEEIFPGSKVVGVGMHVQSGQLHADIWAHDFEEAVVKTGKKKNEVKIQRRRIDSLCHYGSGSGIVALDRHVSALGDMAKTICPETLEEVMRAKASKLNRSELAGRGTDANRDIRMHAAIDELFTGIMDQSVVIEAKSEYQDHLSRKYGAGLSGPRKLRDSAMERVDRLRENIFEAQATLSEKEKAVAEKEKNLSESVIVEASNFLGADKQEGESEDEYKRRLIRKFASQKKALSNLRKIKPMAMKLSKEGLPTRSKNKKLNLLIDFIEMLFETLGIDHDKSTPSR